MYVSCATIGIASFQSLEAPERARVGGKLFLVISDQLSLSEELVEGVNPFQNIVLCGLRRGTCSLKK